MVNEVSKVLGLDKNKDLIMKIIQFVLLFGAIYGVYNDATKNLDAAKAANRIRPWLSRSEEEQRQLERVARVRRENGIPSPEEWMW